MFKTRDIILKRYQLQKPLGNTAVGHQTWLADDLQSPIRSVANSGTNLFGLKWLNFLTSLLRRKSYQKVTLKLLAFSPQIQWDQFKLFEREAQILKLLNHPRIPRYQNYFEIEPQETNGICWFGLVQDYIPGNSLQDLLDQGEQFSEEKVRFIATEVLKILIYLHQLNPSVLHRDLKPSNLILGEDQQIYLIDFGAVQAQNVLNKVTFTIVGTTGYTPLEQFWGRAVPASDLYALGITLIHLLTGIKPNDLTNQKNIWQLLENHNIQHSFKKWLKQLTNIEVENRYQTAEEALNKINYSEDSVEDKNLLALDILTKNKIELTKSETELKISLAASSFRIFKILLNKIPLIEDNIFSNNTFLKLIILGSLFGSPIVLVIAAIILRNGPIIVGGLEIMGGLYFLGFCSLILIYLISLLRGKIELEFSNNTLKIKEKIIGFKYYEGTELYQNIVGIFIHKIIDRYQVSINTRNNIYFLGNKLSKEEALWLAKEIQDWL
ncbi:MAG TPA: serine/threonine protein kinase [Cyanothece sp. UBA12306]|nr:serine/threonine protein kinase [Cyanothece sp. UBA12306]